MQELFEHIDDELYQLADKSASDVLQTRYFDAMRELRKLRERMAAAGYAPEDPERPATVVTGPVTLGSRLRVTADADGANLAVLTEGPSRRHPEANNRMELIDLGQR